MMGFLLYIDVNYLDFLRILHPDMSLGQKFPKPIHNMVEIQREISTLKR
ncbi:hypothetical protein VCRA2122O12_20102 [Vibrio crassostreae]|nr:hypothetical protein VCRA2110O4_20103 [Vibrio crassostreae]CAK1980998.1 hypothetical protein VCRA2114E5_20103 [Vibrio crassostreae]CAK2170753.1 hypothetical protein VCRA2110O1_80059 [Vibrio crassostreae]CAK2832135.1 hypothetical protein VCRA2110O3_30135 [Vibrio crassostreae]CAK2898585.1 hypothetical protein VCRA2110O2_40103 [Vibrio crassostreae]